MSAEEESNQGWTISGILELRGPSGDIYSFDLGPKTGGPRGAHKRHKAREKEPHPMTEFTDKDNPPASEVAWAIYPGTRETGEMLRQAHDLVNFPVISRKVARHPEWSWKAPSAGGIRSLYRKDGSAPIGWDSAVGHYSMCCITNPGKLRVIQKVCSEIINQLR